jgi:hypothetical protein
MKKPKPKRKQTYRSPESRARQLAGLSGVRIEDHVMGTGIQKINGAGPLASVSEDVRKQIIELYCKGMSLRAIEEITGLSRQVCMEVKQTALDHDSQFRNAMFKVNLRGKLQSVVESAADRVAELMPEMSAKDSVLALGIAFDKVMSMDKNNGPDTLHQHIHMHAPAELNNAFMAALKPTNEQ